MTTSAVKPGCFGAPSIFAFDSEICRKCHVFDACSQESFRTLESIKGMIDVRDLFKKHTLAKAAVAAKTAVTPKKVVRPFIEMAPSSEVPIERVTPQQKVTVEVNPEYVELVSTMPKKVQKDVIRLCERGELDGAVQALQEGRNPFSTSVGFVWRAANLLLAGGFDRATLRQYLVDKMTIQNTTAGPYVSTIVAFFPKLGLAVEKDGFFTIPEVAA